MHFHVITLFPEMIEQACSYGVLGRAIKQGIVNVSCWNPRDYAQDRHRTLRGLQSVGSQVHSLQVYSHLQSHGLRVGGLHVTEGARRGHPGGVSP